MVTNLDASDYLGPPRHRPGGAGHAAPGARWPCSRDRRGHPVLKRKPHPAAGIRRRGPVDVDERVAGDLFVLAGFPEVEIGDTLADPDVPEALPASASTSRCCA
jgi:GTP-binding protein